MMLPHLTRPHHLHPLPVMIPIGTVIAFAGKISDPIDPEKQADYTTVNESMGWLLCDGRAVSKDDYGALYAVLGDQYNTGNEKKGEFSIPDYRGYFLRMVTMDSKRDPDPGDRRLPNKNFSEEVGSRQEDALQWHQHKYDKPGPPTLPSGDLAPGGLIKGGDELTSDPTDNLIDVDNNVRCSTETRAKNTYVYYLIKFTM